MNADAAARTGSLRQVSEPVQLGEPIDLRDVERVALGAPVALGDGARGRVRAARDVIERAVAAGTTMYGVTTGFGALADTRIDPSQASALQHGIVTSHATAVGPDLSRAEARAMLLLRAHVLALGYLGRSGGDRGTHGGHAEPRSHPGGARARARSVPRATSHRSRASPCL